jgi:hypothetical protein
MPVKIAGTYGLICQSKARSAPLTTPDTTRPAPGRERPSTSLDPAPRAPHRGCSRRSRRAGRSRAYRDTAEFQTVPPQLRDLRREVFDFDHEAIPSARLGTAHALTSVLARLLQRAILRT